MDQAQALIDAAARVLDAVEIPTARARAGVGEPCPYTSHRADRWTLIGGGGHVVCGVCHPPARWTRTRHAAS